MPAPLEPVTATRPPAGRRRLTPSSARETGVVAEGGVGERHLGHAVPARRRVGRVVHRDRHVLEREEALRRGADLQRVRHRQRDAGDRLEGGQRRQRQHRHHDLADVVSVDCRDARRQHCRDRHGQAGLHEHRHRDAETSVATLQRVGADTELFDLLKEARLGAEGQQLGRTGERVHHVGRERAGECGHLGVPTAPPGEEGGHGEGHQEREAEGEGGPGRMTPTATVPIAAAPTATATGNSVRR